MHDLVSWRDFKRTYLPTIGSGIVSPSSRDPTRRGLTAQPPPQPAPDPGFWVLVANLLTERSPHPHTRTRPRAQPREDGHLTKKPSPPTHPPRDRARPEAVLSHRNRNNNVQAVRSEGHPDPDLPSERGGGGANCVQRSRLPEYQRWPGRPSRSWGSRRLG
jgi:hypothetical protein